MLVSVRVSAASPCLPQAELPAISGPTLSLSGNAELQTAIQNAAAGTTLLLAPGTYNLSSTLYIRTNNLTIRGNGGSCEAVVLNGAGMDNADYGNAPHGIWTDAADLQLMNLTIQNFYLHGVVLNSGAQSPTFDSVQILNTGQQLVKGNPTQYGVGVDNGVVLNSRFAYTNGTPQTDHGAGIGYTNGIDIHAGDNWLISGNRFENFHTPDSSSWWWNPAVLMWNGGQNSVVENNVFINVDRAIAFGLMERNGDVDHSGGIIRNNMVYYAPGQFSSNRIADSDGAILVWNSPNTVVAHNTVLSNGNLNKSIEFRFSTTTGAQAINNLVDAPIGSRNSASFSQSGNLTSADADMFVDAATANLRLNSSAIAAVDKVSVSEYATTDIDGFVRSGAGKVDIGAHELNALSPPNPPTDISGSQL